MSSVSSVLTDEALVELYVTQRRSIGSIVREYGGSPHTWSRRLKRLGHTIRPSVLPLDLSGQVFGWLTVVEYLGRRLPSETNNKRVFWRCKCQCGNEKSVSTHALRQGHTLSCGCFGVKLNQPGSTHPAWKGGRRLNGKGYMHVRVDGKSHLEHRLVMEAMLGRKLLDSEHVHHVNGIRDDNRPENLELWAKPHPYGQRMPDVIAHAIDTLKRYAPHLLPYDVDCLGVDYCI